MKFQDFLEDDGSENLFDMKRKRELDARRRAAEEKNSAFVMEDFSENTKSFTHTESDEADTIIFEEPHEESGTSVPGGLALRMHSLPMVNGYEGFGYNASYRVPYSRFLEVFGPSFTFHQYLQVAMHAWGGSCFGMAFFNIDSYLGRQKLSGYVQSGKSLSDTAYDGIREDALKKKYCYADIKSELTAAIERLYLVQYSSTYADVEVKERKIQENEAERMQRYFNGILREKKPYMLVIRWVRNGYCCGHALTVESGRAPENLDGDWKRIYLCDPNYPYHDFKGENCREYYNKASNRYIDINVATGEWKMEAMLNANNGNSQDVIGSANHQSSMLMVDLTSLSCDFETSKLPIHPALTASYNSIAYDSPYVVVSDHQGQEICRVVNGVMTAKKGADVTHVPMTGMTVDGPFVQNRGSILLPEDNVQVYVKGGRVSFRAAESELGFVGEDSYTVTIYDGREAEVTAENPTKVNVVAWAGHGEIYSSWMTDLEIIEEASVVYVTENKLRLETPEAQTIDVEVINENGTLKHEGVSTRGGLFIRSREEDRSKDKKEQGLSK